MELPEVTNSTELDALRRTPERWMPVASEIAHSHCLDAESLEDLGGANLVVAVGTHHVIKLIPDVCRREFEAETRALSLLEKQHMSAMIPQILATNSSKTWNYIVMTRVRGEPLWSRREEIPTSDLLSVLHEIGSLLAVLRGLEFEPDDLFTPSSWTQFLSVQARLCAARQARWGVHDHLIAGIPNAVILTELNSVSRLTLVHGDLTDGNVLIEKKEGRWQLTGLIDFGDARLGDSLFDLATPALLIARSQPELLSALFEGYGISLADRSSRLMSRLFTYAVIHPFGDLTRFYDPQDPPESLEELGGMLFPIEKRELR